MYTKHLRNLSLKKISLPLLFAVGAFFIYGCANVSHEVKAFQTAHYNFKYTKDPKSDPWYAFTNINNPFSGDCEDFAFTLQRAIGGQVMYTILERTAHAVLLKDGVIYDSRYKWPISAEDYQGAVIYEMHFEIKGTIINNG